MSVIQVQYSLYDLESDELYFKVIGVPRCLRTKVTCASECALVYLHWEWSPRVDILCKTGNCRTSGDWECIGLKYYPKIEVRLSAWFQLFHVWWKWVMRLQTIQFYDILGHSPRRKYWAYIVDIGYEHRMLYVLDIRVNGPFWLIAQTLVISGPRELRVQGLTISNMNMWTEQWYFIFEGNWYEENKCIPML